MDEQKFVEVDLGISKESIQELKVIFENVMVACENGSEGVYG
ncbi:MAG TPA: hypothetical protein PLZ62_01445 [bacterium]|nr:hypothetical protein [bacterium]